MSGHYTKLGIDFLYPENWRITDEETKSWPRSVTVQNSQGAFWSLMVYDNDDPGELTEQVKLTMESEYDEIEASKVVEEFGDFATEGFELSFYCLDFLVAARTLAARAANQTYLMIWQAEDRDFAELEPVFQAISTSLFANVTKAVRAAASE